MSAAAPNDYLDDLVASLNGVGDPADQGDDLPEPVEEPAEPPVGLSGPKAPGPAGGPEEPGPELLDVPEEIRAEPERPAAAIGGVGLASSGEAAGRAAGAVEGRMMVVMPEGQGEGMDAVAAAVQSIALMGLPAGGAATKAVGSKI